MDGAGLIAVRVNGNVVESSAFNSLPKKMNIVPAEMPQSKLSGVMIVIIIGGGVLLSFVLFIFAKRQIMRFTIRSRRGPHAPVGHDAKKVGLNRYLFVVQLLNLFIISPLNGKLNDDWIAFSASLTSPTLSGTMTHDTFFGQTLHCRRSIGG